MSELFNTILVVVICCLATAHINGFFSISRKSPSVIWLKSKRTAVVVSLTVLFVIVALAKILLLLV